MFHYNRYISYIQIYKMYKKRERTQLTLRKINTKFKNKYEFNTN
jgi:hypothetical protein